MVLDCPSAKNASPHTTLSDMTITVESNAMETRYSDNSACNFIEMVKGALPLSYGNSIAARFQKTPFFKTVAEMESYPAEGTEPATVTNAESNASRAKNCYGLG